MASTAFVATAYRLGARDRSRKPALTILYNENDPAYVRPLRDLHDQNGEFYSIGLINKGQASLDDVCVRALDSHFTQAIIAAAHLMPEEYHRYKRGPVTVFERASLHPGAPKMIQLFGLNFESGVSVPEYILNHPSQFTIEVSAKNTPSIQHVFEYHPQSRPMLRMLG